MTETSTRRKPSSPSISPSAPYYGLATQLRTPPTDFSSSFPMSKSLSSSSTSNKKLTPAMRDEFGFNPKFVPQWSSKGEQGEEGGLGGFSHEGSPSLGAIQSSPKHSRTSGRHSTAPRPHHTPHASMSTSSKQHRRADSLRDTPVFGKVDFNFKPMQQPLDLTVTLDPVSTTTYQGNDDKIVEEPEESSTLPLRSNSLSRKKSLRQNEKSPKSPSLASPSLSRSQQPPSPSMRPPPMTLPDSFAAAFPLSRTITPASKGTMNLITLARRTTHLADVPGYGWRLNLLEKLEVLTGSFIAIRDAESILAIGSGQQATAAASNASKLESRKSQIFLPAATSPKDPHKLTKAKSSKVKADDKSFFGKMRRALSNPGAPQVKEVPPPMPPPKRVVFGQKLSQVAEYGFVTSMIAGQRHDLPGVCFSSVEEIYRRGQGSKVPGLLQLAGEPGRVARLVQIFDAGPDYGEHHDLSVESIHNVCSLLKKYLHDLPEPVLDERVYRLFLAGCVDSANSLPRRVASAQIILRLLPSANFSLLVYLVAFLSQIPLFPANPLSLNVVAQLFGTSVMSPRKNRNSSASSSPSMKKTRGQMIITGPTDLVDDQDGKKANQALEWLLTNWSAVADGLLEPDFDVEVEAIVGSSSSSTGGGSSPPMIPLSPTVMKTFESSSSPRAAPNPPTSGPFQTRPPIQISVPAEGAKAPSTEDIPRYLDTLEDDDEESRSEGEDEANDSSATKTPRPQSDSSYATSIETPPTRSFDERRGSRKTAEPSQLSPEDERGPLDYSNNTGDEVVEFDDYSSVYSFPAPPTSLPSTYHHRLPSLPPSPFLTQDEIALALAEQEKAVQSSSSTFSPLDQRATTEEEDDPDRTEDLDVTSLAVPPSTSSSVPRQAQQTNEIQEFEPLEKTRKRSSIIAAPSLVRSKSIQLEESRTLVLQQKLEIQNLWTKLSGLETERIKEREEMFELTREVENFKSSLKEQVKEVEGGETLRLELENVRNELKRCEEEREREREKAKEQVQSLENQLKEIRKVLVPLLGSSSLQL
ncbi:hypothetical protein JCM5350_006668 [Sporobolomyces pararoseus]